MWVYKNSGDYNFVEWAERETDKFAGRSNLEDIVEKINELEKEVTELKESKTKVIKLIEDILVIIGKGRMIPEPYSSTIIYLLKRCLE